MTPLSARIGGKSGNQDFVTFTENQVKGRPSKV